jgi:hypothetical protein
VVTLEEKPPSGPITIPDERERYSLETDRWDQGEAFARLTADAN